MWSHAIIPMDAAILLSTSCTSDWVTDALYTTQIIAWVWKHAESMHFFAVKALTIWQQTYMPRTKLTDSLRLKIHSNVIQYNTKKWNKERRKTFLALISGFNFLNSMPDTHQQRNINNLHHDLYVYTCIGFTHSKSDPSSSWPEPQECLCGMS